MCDVALRRLMVACVFSLSSNAVNAQSSGNQWNPYPAPQNQSQVQQFAPPKFIGDAPVPLMAEPPKPEAPSKFAPAGLDRSLDTMSYQSGPVPNNSPQPQYPMPQQNFASGPNAFAPGPGTNPGFGYGGYPPVNGGFAQGYNGYPQPYGPPAGYGNPAYQGTPGFGSGFAPGYGSGYATGFGGANPNSSFGMPGGFGNFPGTFSNGGVPGFGFSPFGFF